MAMPSFISYNIQLHLGSPPQGRFALCLVNALGPHCHMQLALQLLQQLHFWSACSKAWIPYLD